MHESAAPRVSVNVSYRLVWVLLVFTAALSAQTDTAKLLRTIEQRYNRTATLQVGFSQTLTQQGRRRTESGELSLRKPGRMRWEYSNPAGKLFVSDGKEVYFYSPQSNRAEKLKLKETDDMRAPMAFLLGRLDFSRDFKEFHTKAAGNLTEITAIPKSDKLPYREVSFAVTPEGRIDHLTVTNQDSTTLAFTFSNERLNPKVPESAFQFKLPPGAEFIDSSVETEAAR